LAFGNIFFIVKNGSSTRRSSWPGNEAADFAFARNPLVR
jgi:hypothetical protein